MLPMGDCRPSKCVCWSGLRNQTWKPHLWGYDGIGRRVRLKIWWPRGRVGSSPTIPPIRGIRKIKNVERQATDPVRWPPRWRGVGGSRQMRISCNPLIFRMRGGKYIHSPLEKGFSNRECGRKSRRIHQYSCGRIRLKTLILHYATVPWMPRSGC